MKHVIVHEVDRTAELSPRYESRADARVRCAELLLEMAGFEVVEVEEPAPTEKP
jgi:hypothetical protein